MTCLRLKSRGLEVKSSWLMLAFLAKTFPATMHYYSTPVIEIKSLLLSLHANAFIYFCTCVQIQGCLVSWLGSNVTVPR